jgi:hypothetical protein
MTRPYSVRVESLETTRDLLGFLEDLAAVLEDVDLLAELVAGRLERLHPVGGGGVALERAERHRGDEDDEHRQGGDERPVAASCAGRLAHPVPAPRRAALGKADGPA